MPPDAADALRLLEENILPVIVDPKAESAKELHPDVIVDAILAKENLGTTITDAPGVVGVGRASPPGRTATPLWKRCAATRSAA